MTGSHSQRQAAPVAVARSNGPTSANRTDSAGGVTDCPSELSALTIRLLALAVKRSLNRPIHRTFLSNGSSKPQHHGARKAPPPPGPDRLARSVRARDPHGLRPDDPRDLAVPLLSGTSGLAEYDQGRARLRAGALRQSDPGSARHAFAHGR